MTISFISFSAKPESFLDDASFRYRCQNLSYALNLARIPSRLEHIDSFLVATSISYVVFHRPRYSARFKRIVNQLKKLNITVIADFDDLVFDPVYLEFMPAILNNIQSRRHIRRRLVSHYEAMLHIENITVSTHELGRYARASFPDVKICVLQNFMHYDWPVQSTLTNLKKQKTISYFPGTRSHDRDFWQVEDVIAYFLAKHKEVDLLVIGPLSSQLLKKKSPQIKHINRLPFSDYVQAASNSWVNLLPLEPTPFNQCKSAIKVIEAGSYATPTICSPLADTIRFSNAGASIAIDQKQWLQQLELFLDPELYMQNSLRMQSNFQRLASNKNMVDIFIKPFDISAAPTKKH